MRVSNGYCLRRHSYNQWLRRAVVEVDITIRAFWDDGSLSSCKDKHISIDHLRVDGTRTVGGQNRERSRASLLEIAAARTGREGCRLLYRRKRLGDDIGTVDKIVRVVADDSKLRHSRLEVGHHKLLVVDHALPFTSSALSWYNTSVSFPSSSCVKRTRSRARAKSDWRRISFD